MLTVIVTIRGGLHAVLTDIVTITRMSLFSVYSYYDNNVRYISSANSYCDNNDNNGEVYM